MNKRITTGIGATLLTAGITIAAWNLHTNQAPTPTATWTTTPNSTPRPQPTTGPVRPDNMEPDRLLIPSLNIYTHIIDKPITDGLLQLPQHTKVARYSSGATVTDSKGTILISGHVTAYGDPGALHQLANIRPGDWFYITDSKGNRANFIATSLTIQHKTSLSQDLFNTDGPRRAALVTCTGRIVTRADGTRHYDSNLIVEGTQIGQANRPPE